MKIRHLAAIAFPLAMGACYAAAFTWVLAALWWYLGAAALLVIGLVVVIRPSVFTAEFWLLAIAPLTFTYSYMAFLLFLGNPATRVALIVIGLLFTGIYLHVVYVLGHEPSKYQQGSVEVLSSYLNLLSLFCFSVVAYGLLVFLTIPLWLLTLLLSVHLALLFVQSFWAHHISKRFAFSAGVVLLAVLIELFWALAYIPIHFFVHGSLFALAYYELWGMTKAHAKQQLTRALAMRYAAIGAALAAAIIITTNWI